jgi:hypothetical protein
MRVRAVLDHAAIRPVDVEQLLDDGVRIYGRGEQPQRRGAVLVVDELGAEQRLAKDAEVQDAGLGLADGDVTIAERQGRVRAMPLPLATDEDAVDVTRAGRSPVTVGTTNSSTSSPPSSSQTACTTSLSASDRPR